MNSRQTINRSTNKQRNTNQNPLFLTQYDLPLPHEPIHNEYEILRAVQEEDEKAFEQLFMHYKDRVYDIAMMYTESTVHAEEIVQDVFVKIWTQRKELTKIDNLSSWIFTATRNRSFNVLRDVARSKTREQEYIDHMPKETQQPDQNETEKLIEQAKQLLTPQQKEAFELFKMQGLSREETAKIMNLSPNTVKVHLLHALRTIRAYLVSNNVTSIAILASFPIFLEKI